MSLWLLSFDVTVTPEVWPTFLHLLYLHPPHPHPITWPARIACCWIFAAYLYMQKRLRRLRNSIYAAKTAKLRNTLTFLSFDSHVRRPSYICKTTVKTAITWSAFTKSQFFSWKAHPAGASDFLARCTLTSWEVSDTCDLDLRSGFAAFLYMLRRPRRLR